MGCELPNVPNQKTTKQTEERKTSHEQIPIEHEIKAGSRHEIKMSSPFGPSESWVSSQGDNSTFDDFPVQDQILSRIDSHHVLPVGWCVCGLLVCLAGSFSSAIQTYSLQSSQFDVWPKFRSSHVCKGERSSAWCHVMILIFAPNSFLLSTVCCCFLANQFFGTIYQKKWWLISQPRKNW